MNTHGQALPKQTYHSKKSPPLLDSEGDFHLSSSENMAANQNISFLFFFFEANTAINPDTINIGIIKNG